MKRTCFLFGSSYITGSSSNAIMDDLHLCMLFYRCFLKQIMSFSKTESHASTIKEKLAAMGPALEHFQKLHIKNARFSGRKHRRTDDDEQENIMILSWSSEQPPPLLQRKK